MMTIDLIISMMDGCYMYETNYPPTLFPCLLPNKSAPFLVFNKRASQPCNSGLTRWSQQSTDHGQHHQPLVTTMSLDYSFPVKQFIP